MYAIRSYYVLEPALSHVARYDLLAPGGILVAEAPAEKTLPSLAPPYGVSRVYRYGKIGLTVYRRGADGEKGERAE